MQNRFLAYYITSPQRFCAISVKGDELAVKKEGYPVKNPGFSLLRPMLWGRGYLPHTPTSNYFFGPTRQYLGSTRSKKHPILHSFTAQPPTPVFIGHPDL